jgi:hypothetical protein
MSTRPLASIDPAALVAVTGGGKHTVERNLDDLLGQLSSLKGSIRDVHRKTSGLSQSDMLLLCMLAMQNRSAPADVVYVRTRTSPWW